MKHEACNIVDATFMTKHEPKVSMILFLDTPNDDCVVRHMEVPSIEGQLCSISGVDDTVIVTTQNLDLYGLGDQLLQRGGDVLSTAHNSRDKGRRICSFFQDNQYPMDLQLGPTIVISRPPDGSRELERDGIRGYHSFVFDDQTCRGVPPVRYLSVGRAPKTIDPPFSSEGQIAYDSATIVSGLCLLSLNMRQQGEIAAGGFTTPQLRYDTATFTEAEEIVRLSMAIADIAVIFAQRYSSVVHDNETRTQIVLDVPTWQYYHAMEERLLDGRCQTLEVLDWLYALEHRSLQVSTVFEKAVKHELKLRGCGSVRLLHTRSMPESKLILQMIKGALQCGEIPNMRTVLNTLAVQGGEPWSRFTRFLREREHPLTFKSLGYLFYSYQFIRPLLCSNGSFSQPEVDTHSPIPDTTRPRRLLVAVDDCSERKLYSISQNIIKRIRADPQAPSIPTVIELYPVRKVCGGASRAGQSFLPTLDPSPNKMLLISSNPSKTTRSTPDRRSIHEEEQIQRMPMGPAEYVTLLYGSEKATLLRNWFANVNLKC